MKVMKIYEPAMCCSTGLCGVGVDTELLRISTVLNALKGNHIEIERINLSNSPHEFVTNKIVNQFINEKGIDGLPITVLDGVIIITGRYPTNDEFVTYLNIPRSYLGEKPSSVIGAEKESGCCGCSHE